MDQIQALRVVSEVAHRGSLAAASRAMNLSAPSVTRILAEIEADLGVRLFNRSTRTVALTGEGEKFLAGSRPILEALDTLWDETRNQHVVPAGRLVVSSAVAFGNEMLAPILPEFQRRYPDVAIDLQMSSRSVDLIEEHVDVALRVGRGVLPDSALSARRICRFRMIFVASPEHVDRHGLPASLDELAQRPVVKLATGSWGHVQRLATPGGEVDFRLPDSYCVDSYRAQLWALLNGANCSLMHEYVARPELEAGRLVRLLPDHQTVDQEIFAIFAHRQLMAARIRVFLDFLVESLK